MKKNVSFKNIQREFIYNKKYKQLNNEFHHGISRMEHIVRVSKYVYKITKFLHFDYVSATRAAFLHDFFVNEDMMNNTSFRKLFLHPSIAVENSLKYNFALNKNERHSIEAHMFPLGKKIPHSKEAIILSLVDKGVALYECNHYKFKNGILKYAIFARTLLISLFIH